jgi:tripartite-type tricarboxylate transporter receptor subunit TctC
VRLRCSAPRDPPAGTPREIVDLIYREIVAALTTHDMKERLATLGFVLVANTPAEFARMIGPRGRAVEAGYSGGQYQG